MCAQFQLVIFVSVFALSGLTGIGPVAAQAEVFSAQVRNNMGTCYSLIIRKNGSRLSFNMGWPRCEEAELKQDGTFSTYCGGFLNVGSVRGYLYGNLETATLEPLPYIGGATFKFVKGSVVRGQC